MSFNYTPLTQSASKLLTKFGQLITFTRTADGDFDPITGTTSKTVSTYTKHGCLFNYTDSDRANQTILANDRRLLAEGYDYQVGDTLVVNGDTFRVVSVSLNQPAGTALSANLQIRK